MQDVAFTRNQGDPAMFKGYSYQNCRILAEWDRYAQLPNGGDIDDGVAYRALEERAHVASPEMAGFSVYNADSLKYVALRK